MKIQQVKHKNVLIRVLTPPEFKKTQAELVIRKEPKKFYVAEILAVGDKVDDTIQPQQKYMIFAQSLNHIVDLDELKEMSGDPDYDYFMVFEEELMALLIDG